LNALSGVDWWTRWVKKTIKVKQVIDGVEKDVDKRFEEEEPAILKAVSHLYSMELKHGPPSLRLRTGNRTDNSAIFRH